MVIAVNTANGKATDPRIIAVAEGRVNSSTADGPEVVFDDEDGLENDLRPVAAPSFRRLLGSSQLWAIPVSYLACSVSVTVAMVIGMLGDGYDASSSSFVSAVLVGFFLWGTMIFVATSYMTIPALTVTIAVVRYGLRRLRAELPE
ncbi:MAG: hypothetical protein C0482_05205 [Gordonia sp.]|nr:hypothetical protein [Gordonia sp. (in: high G+C Gram-positive bacteria)]